MSETQNIQESTTQQTPNAEAPASVDALKAEALTDLSAIIQVAREYGIKVADLGLFYGQFALERSARALEGAAGRLSELQARLKREDAHAEATGADASASTKGTGNTDVN